MDIWWQKIKKPLLVVGIIAASVLVIALIIVVVLGYRLNWPWVGVSGGNSKIMTTTTATGQPPAKTLWDWLQLLFIPAILTLGAIWFTARQNHDLHITLDNQRETVLQTYLDKMSDLILHENLHNAKRGDKVRNIARARTLTALSKLDPSRKRSIILFLWESDLINIDEEKIDLSWADLREADLSLLILNASGFGGAYLQEANFSGADVSQSTHILIDSKAEDSSKGNLLHW